MAAKKRKRKTNSKSTASLIAIALFVAIAVILYFAGAFDRFIVPDTDISDNGDNGSSAGSSDNSGNDSSGVNPTGSKLAVHFIDVGQADCILLINNSKVMLVDTGDTDNDITDKIIDYIDGLGIKKIDYLVLTHPDADHIGGAPEIIEKYEIGKCLMPDFAKTTKIYENTIDALLEKDVDTECPEPGSSFTLGDATCKVLAPISDYDDANEVSIVIKVMFGKRSILLTGDAEHESEADMSTKYSAAELKSDVLKSGHHGSSTSSSEAFLNKVDPDYVVISCGTGNSYGHPHKETMDRYQKKGYTYYRTDEQGTIVLTTDGTTMSFSVEK